MLTLHPSTIQKITLKVGMRAIRKFTEHKITRLITNVIFLVLGFYISIQKFFNFHLYTYFDGTFTHGGWQGVKYFALTVLVAACLIKLASTYYEIFPEGAKKAQEPERIAQCLLRINDEIKEHLAGFNAVSAANCKDFDRYHHFQDNVRMILGNMADHIMRAFPGLKELRERDIFLSLFEYRKGTDSGYLDYLCHWKPNRDSVFSPQIRLLSPVFKKYECVKAITEGRNAIVKWDCSDYVKGSKRGQIQHYVGLRIEIRGETLGFLNIEFHNRNFFEDEQNMTIFVENELIAFKYLIEYQFLKKHFFSSVTHHLMEDTKS